MRKYLYSLLAGLSLVSMGCSTNLSIEGKKIKLLTDVSGYECQSLGEVSGFDTFSSTVEKEKKHSLYELMNKAAEMGGNGLLRGKHETSAMGTEVKGIVLKCVFERRLLKPSIERGLPKKSSMKGQQ